MAKTGFATSAQGRAWSGDANAIIERLTNMVDNNSSASVSEWQTICRQLGEVMAGSNPQEFCTNASYRAALVTALTI